MQIKSKIETDKPENKFEEALERALRDYTFSLSELLNGGLKFADNFDCDIITVADSGNADTEFTEAHTLKRVPTGFIIININKGGVVYDSGTSWTTTNIYLKCTQANCEIKLIII